MNADTNLPENATGPTVDVGQIKEGWCNGCSDRPPYTPNETTKIRSKTTVMAYCPKCTVKLVVLLTQHVNDRGFR